MISAGFLLMKLWVRVYTSNQIGNKPVTVFYALVSTHTKSQKLVRTKMLKLWIGGGGWKDVACVLLTITFLFEQSFDLKLYTQLYIPLVSYPKIDNGEGLQGYIYMGSPCLVPHNKFH